MADTVPITAGTGTTIATDDTGATGHIQLFKLAYSADGVATLVPADATGLYISINGKNPAYTEGNTDGSIDGVPVFWEDVADTLVSTSASKPMPVNPVVSDITGAGPFDTIGAALIPMSAPPTGITGMSIGPGSGKSQISANSINATSIKATPGQVYWIYAHNINAAVRYFKLWNKASAPSPGSDSAVIVLTVPIPASSAGNGVFLNFPIPIPFTTGIASAITTGVAETDTGVVAANEIVVSLGYR